VSPEEWAIRAECRRQINIRYKQRKDERLREEKERRREEKRIEKERNKPQIEENAKKRRKTRHHARHVKRQARWDYLSTFIGPLNKEETLELEKETQRRNKKKTYMAEYLLKNKERIREVSQKYLQKYRKSRASTDHAFACLVKARSRVTDALKGVTKTKNKKTGDRFLDYFGCDRATLVTHIESLFKDGMEWSNRGIVWHLDHIVPMRVGLGNEDLIFRLNHYRNLQPLSVAENLSKADRLPEIWPEGVPFTKEEVEESLRKIAQTPPAECNIL